MPNPTEVNYLIRFLLHRVLDLENEVTALEVALKIALKKKNPTLMESVAKAKRVLEDAPEAQRFRAAIDKLAVSDILDALAKYEGPEQ